MRPANLKSQLFLDSGDPAETEHALRILGFLDGQTTNPTLIAKHPEAKQRLEEGRKFTSDEIFRFYRNQVEKISKLIPDGSVSIEVYADAQTTAAQMLTQGFDMFSWIPNVHIKYPTTAAGLGAAEQSVQKSLRVNMTLCFSQAQAAAVYAATHGAKPGAVFVSPFIGRLDDQGINGMDLIKNIAHMYKTGNGHVAILAASVRSLNHFLYALQLGTDIITAPLALYKEWAAAGMPLPDEHFHYDISTLKPIPYQQLNVSQPWNTFDIVHPLTQAGIVKFSTDWNSLVQD